jgi:hypothetical protein
MTSPKQWSVGLARDKPIDHLPVSVSPMAIHALKESV